MTLGVLGSRREVRVRYSFFSEVAMVTFESAEDTTVVLVDNLVGVKDSLGVFVGLGCSVVLSVVALSKVWIKRTTLIQ